MRAKFIYETINFERGLNPIKAMDLGQEYLWKNLKKGDILECREPIYLNYNHRFSKEKDHFTKYSETVHTPIKKGNKIKILDLARVSSMRDRELLHIAFIYIDPTEKQIQENSYDPWMVATIKEYKKYFNIIQKNA
jgi:hypothetical protein